MILISWNTTQASARWHLPCRLRLFVFCWGGFLNRLKSEHLLFQLLGEGRLGQPVSTRVFSQLLSLHYTRLLRQEKRTSTNTPPPAPVRTSLRPPPGEPLGFSCFEGFSILCLKLKQSSALPVSLVTFCLTQFSVRWGWGGGLPLSW